jgi:hypothetical protein
MIDMFMNGSTVNVGTGPDGAKLLEIGDPESGIRVKVILPGDSARKIAGALTGIQLATHMPEKGKGI